MAELTCIEICAGGGGQALGLELAGFAHAAVVEIDPDACETLGRNRGSRWKIIEADVAAMSGAEFRGVDLLAGGVPCPPFSVAGHQLGAADERDLFPEALRLTSEIQPRAVLLENMRGLAAGRFDAYRAQVVARLGELGYQSWWQLMQASDHGVPQLRPRLVLVAVRWPWAAVFRWPAPSAARPSTVGATLADLMSARGWPGAADWVSRAAGCAHDRRRPQEARRARSRPDSRETGVASARGRWPRHRRCGAGRVVPASGRAQADHPDGGQAPGIP